MRKYSSAANTYGRTDGSGEGTRVEKKGSNAKIILALKLETSNIYHQMMRHFRHDVMPISSLIQSDTRLKEDVGAIHENESYSFINVL